MLKMLHPLSLKDEASFLEKSSASSLSERTEPQSCQPHRQIECLVVVHLFEGSTHALQYTMTPLRDLLLSDTLLEEGFSSPEIA